MWRTNELAIDRKLKLNFRPQLELSWQCKIYLKPCAERRVEGDEVENGGRRTSSGNGSAAIACGRCCLYCTLCSCDGHKNGLQPAYAVARRWFIAVQSRLINRAIK